MQPKLLTASILAASLTLGATVQAADVRINGFVSVVGGTTLSEGKSPSGNKSTYVANSPTNGTYDDDISFKPDTIFGLQVSSNLGDGLSVTGQITGAGGEDFDANVAWAYITYELNDSWALMAGRQRIPFFMNSDYLDVGYAYHWMRPPTETDVVVDDFEGIKFRHSGYAGDWDTRFEVYLGENSAESAALGPIGLEDILGVVIEGSTDSVKLRATHMVADIYIEQLATSNLSALQLDLFGHTVGQGDDSPVGVSFSGIAGRWDIGSTFLMAEYTTYTFDQPIMGAGLDTFVGYYVSLGHRMGEFTPHITYSVAELETKNLTNDMFNGNFNPGNEDDSTITVGVRWDFHPSAAAKVEYSSRSDDSDANIIAAFGEAREVDLFTVGIDVIF